MMHPLLAASVANTLFNDRTSAAARPRRVSAAQRRPSQRVRRHVAAPAHAPRGRDPRAPVADRPALVRLGTLDSDRRAGEMLAARRREDTVLVAEVDGSIEAAVALDDGLAVADPFRPSALHAQLLALRARQLGGHAPRRSRGPLSVLHLRTS